MNFNLVRQDLKTRWKSAFIFALGLVAWGWMIVSLTPVFIGNPEMERLLEAYPEELLAVVGGSVEGVSFFTVEGFLSVEYLSLWWIVILSGFAIGSATGMVAKEVEEGTIDFLLVQPISRTTVILSRFTALTSYLVVLVAISIGTLGLAGAAYDVEISTAGLVAVGVMGLVVSLVVSAYTLLLSLIIKGRGRAVALSVAILIGAHIVNALAPISETLDAIRFLSFFYYYRPAEALVAGEAPWSDLAVLLAMTAVALAASLAVFRKKDIAVI
jgi:ABC-2 type transport system permease protein